MPHKFDLDDFFTCHGCKLGRLFFSSFSEVNTCSTGYSEFDWPISMHLQRYPLFWYILTTLILLSFYSVTVPLWSFSLNRNLQGIWLCH